MKAILKEVKKINSDTVIQRFRTEKNIEFIPGQFFMLEMTLRDEGNFFVKEGKSRVQKRAFSIASAPAGNEFELLVKHEKEGFVSDYLVNVVKEGEIFDITGPYGKFLFHDDIKNAVFIAAGSGIAPIRSMVQYIVKEKLPTTAHVFYSNTVPENILCKEEFDTLPDNISTYYTITRPRLSSMPWNGPTGRLTYATITTQVKNVTDAHFFLCGPVAMCKELRESLIANGVEKSKIALEAWG